MRAWTLLSHFVGACWRWRRLRGRRLREFQDERARDIIRFAVARAPFYRRHFAGCSRRLAEVADRGQIADDGEFRRVRTRAIFAAARPWRSRCGRRNRGEISCRPWLASRSGCHRGRPDIAACSSSVPTSRRHGQRSCSRARVPNFRPRGYTVAFFLRSNSNLYESLGSRSLRLRYHDLMTPLDQTMAALNLSLPDIVVGPPSLLDMLAAPGKRGRSESSPTD